MSQKMQEKRVKLEAMVQSKTVEELKNMAKDADLSVGEMIDRLVLRISTKDVATAVQLAQEEILVSFSSLNPDQFGDALMELLAALAAVLPENELPRMTRLAALKRAEQVRAVAELTEQ